MQNHLKAWRESRDWTLEEMGRHLAGATPSQVSKLERGDQKLTQQWLDRYAKAFGVEPADILRAPGAAAGPSGPAAFDEEAFVAAIQMGLQLSGVKLSRAEEMKLQGHALEIYERIMAGADPATLVAELVKDDDATLTKPAAKPSPARR